MSHHTTPDFWACYERLDGDVRSLADRSFELLQANPRHPSLHFKKVGRFWSVRVGLHYRAVAVEGPDGLVWFWIGEHGEYDRIVG